MINLFDHFGIIITEEQNEKLLANRKKITDIVEILKSTIPEIELLNFTPEEKIIEHEYIRDKMLDYIKNL